MFGIENRRYIGSKAALADWILSSIPERYKSGTFFDVFAGTGIVSMSATKYFDEIIVNDLLFSNEAIYRAFFSKKRFGIGKLTEFAEIANRPSLEGNYFANNFGGKFFSLEDSRQIGYVRNLIDEWFPAADDRNRYIALASLIYSTDRCANTVGHYDAYLKTQRASRFKFELVGVENLKARVYRQDANHLVKKVSCDVAYIDPPYNSRQYSRFYHVLETLVKWDHPELSGVALKPPVENSSQYCTVAAAEALSDLLENLQARFVVISYNNTYTSKSTSSRNKIQIHQMLEMSQRKGTVTMLEKAHKHFNSGNTDFTDHAEYLFLIEVRE